MILGWPEPGSSGRIVSWCPGFPPMAASDVGCRKSHPSNMKMRFLRPRAQGPSPSLPPRPGPVAPSSRLQRGCCASVCDFSIPRGKENVEGVRGGAWVRDLWDFPEPRAFCHPPPWPGKLGRGTIAAVAMPVLDQTCVLSSEGGTLDGGTAMQVSPFPSKLLPRNSLPSLCPHPSSGPPSPAASISASGPVSCSHIPSSPLDGALPRPWCPAALLLFPLLGLRRGPRGWLGLSCRRGCGGQRQPRPGGHPGGGGRAQHCGPSPVAAASQGGLASPSTLLAPLQQSKGF